MASPVTLAWPGRVVRRLPHHRRWAVGLVLAAVTAASLGLQLHRVASTHGRLSADERAYLHLARDVHDRGNWGDFGLKQPFRWAPGTPMLFAATATVSGAPVDRDTAYHAQIAVGTLLVPATFLLAAALAGWLAGLTAAAGAAFYLPLVRSTATAGTETLGALMVVLAALALVLAWQRGPRPLGLLGAGAMLGLATLVRGDLVPVAVLLPIVVGFAAARTAAGHRARRGLACGGAMLAGAVALMAPWSLFASAHMHRFVPVTDGGAANLFIGTYLPGNGTIFGVKHHFAAATRKVHPMVRHVPAHMLPQQLVLDAVAARYPRRSRDAALRAAARDNLRRYALGRPVAFAGMEVRKLWRMWGHAYRGTFHRAGRAATWEHRVFVLLAVAGLLAGLALTRDVRLALLAVFLALTTVVDVAFVSEARHNVRLMPLLLASGASGVVLAHGAWRARRAAAPDSAPLASPEPSPS
jgi:4-amino-4-deoxy-L-arabinose transferase-like glycosyltransferase